MVAAGHAKLSIVCQCRLLSIARSGLYYEKTGESVYNLSLMQEIDRAFTEWPFRGVRQVRDYLRLLGYGVGRKRIHRLMRLMGLTPIYRKPRTSIPNPEHIRYPYLLRDVCHYTAQIRSGARISLTSPCAKAFCTWWPLWTAQQKVIVLETFQHHGR